MVWPGLTLPPPILLLKMAPLTVCTGLSVGISTLFKEAADDRAKPLELSKLNEIILYDSLN